MRKKITRIDLDLENKLGLTARFTDRRGMGRDFRCGGHMAQIEVQGEGDDDYRFPEASELVSRAMRADEEEEQAAAAQKKVRAAKSRKRKAQKASRKKQAATKTRKATAPKRSDGKTESTKSPAKPRGKAAVRGIAIALGEELVPPSKPGSAAIPTVRALPGQGDPLDETMTAGAEGLQRLMSARQLDGILYEKFGADVGTVNWAVNNMTPLSYREPYISLQKQMPILQERYRTALPELVRQLQAKRPNADPQDLIARAMFLLDQELAPILFVIRIYTQAAAQHRDGVYGTELKAISLFYEQLAMLFKQVDPDNPDKVDPKRPNLETIIYKVGDVYLARFAAMGLSTVPGGIAAKGPLKAHALQVPFEFLDCLALVLCLLAHEFRHNLFADVQGLAEEIIAVLKVAILEAYNRGELPLSGDTITIGEAQVSMIELLVKLIVDAIGEIDADIGGGVLNCGVAFLYTMVTSFPAMLIRGKPIRLVKRKLRASSVYQLIEQKDGSHALVFEPHPPDYIRIFIVAAALDVLGFKEEAEECRQLANFGVGKPLPKVLTWEDADEKLDLKIEIPVADIQVLAPVVAKALIHTKLKSLGGRSNYDMINWTPGREKKVRDLSGNMLIALADGTDPQFPSGGSYFSNYVGSAATLTYWKILYAFITNGRGLAPDLWKKLKKALTGGQAFDTAEVAKAVNSKAMCLIAKLVAKRPDEPCACH